MNERVRTKERVLFDVEKKKKILHKSKGVCSHCGKPLDTKSMTVDHVIPLSKGGTNELKNLVALCEECNKSKSNYVVEPEDYLRFLDWVYLKDLIKKYAEYAESVNWVSKRQIISEDMLNATSLKFSNIPTKGKFLVKAWYSDLDDIYNAYIKVHDRKALKRYGTAEKEMLKKFISFIFTEGCFYVHRNYEGTIVLVIPIVMVYLKDLNDKNSLKATVVIPKILAVYKRVYLADLVFTFLCDLIRNGFRWGLDVGTIVPVAVSIFGESRELDLVLSFLKSEFKNVGTNYINEKALHCIKFTVYGDKMERLGEKLEAEKYSDEDYVEDCEKLNKFFSDLNVRSISNDEMMYLMLRTITADIRR